MRWLFLVLFVLAASFSVTDALMRRRKLNATILSASLVKLPNLKDAYQAVAQCQILQTGALARVVGRLRTIPETDLALENDHVRELQGKQIPVYRRPSSFDYSSDAGPFRGYSVDMWMAGLTAICALSAWLYDVWGIQPLFALLRFLGVGGR
jgi:hypothetical protein